MKFNYNKQNITEQDISSVVKTLRSERITQGKKLQEFELLLKTFQDTHDYNAVYKVWIPFHLHDHDRIEFVSIMC